MYTIINKQFCLQNSALRLQRILETFRPAIQGIFGVKGFVIEANTSKPIFSDGSDNR